MATAWTSILSTQTDANSPLNQVLFDAIRNDLDYLRATKSAGGVALGGLIVYDKPDGAAQTIYYSWPNGAEYIEHDRVQNAAWTDVLSGQPVLIPVGCVTCRVHIRGRAEAVSSDLRLRANFANDGYTAVVHSIGTSVGWFYVDVDVTGIETSHPVLFKLEIVNYAATTRWIRVYQIEIEFLE